MRVYLPGTLTTLRAALAAGEVAPVPLTGFAVTPGVREWYTDDDPEELEYAALGLAARASLRLLDVELGRDPSVPPRRVVLAADVADAAVVPRDDLDRGAVSISSVVPLRQVASGHVDAAEAEPDVRAAAEAVVAADLGSRDAAFAVDGADGHELLWYATQELPGLAEGLAAG